jgi:transcriptional regulator with XRE-family HTH domain
LKRHRNKALLLKAANRIKILREQHNITQEVFYNDTGINIGRIERGVNDLTICTLERICDYFNICLKDFFNKSF